MSHYKPWQRIQQPQSRTKRYEFTPPLPSQSRFLNSNSLYKGFSGPIGSGKSMALVWQALKMCAINPGCLGMIGAQTYTMIRDVTQRAFINELERMKMPYQFFRADERIVLPEFQNASIIFRHLEDPDRLRGLNLAWFGLDELTLCREDTWLILEGRLRDPLAKQLCGFAAWTPRGKNWVYEKFGLHQMGEGIDTIKYKNYETIISQPGENLYLREEFYNNLATSYDERMYRQEVMGEYINMYAGEVYYPFSRSIHVNDADIHPYLPIRWSLDFNLNPMTSVIAQIHDDATPTDMAFGTNRKRVVVVDEIFLKNASTPDAVEAFLEKISGYNIRRPVEVYLYGDASGRQAQRANAGARSDWDAVRQSLANQATVPVSVKMCVPEANGPIRDRVGAVNKLLKSFSGESRMVISPKCKHLITDLERVTWEEGTTVQIRQGSSESEKLLNHISDALGYLCVKEFPFTGTGYGYRRESLF